MKQPPPHDRAKSSATGGATRTTVQQTFVMTNRCERVKRNPQLTNGEKSVACSHKQLVRECLPVAVLNHYDRMKKTERTLLTSPEIFAMAVLVATYRSLSPLQRKRLVRHFKTPPPTQGSAARQNAATNRNRSAARRFKAVAGGVFKPSR